MQLTVIMQAMPSRVTLDATLKSLAESDLPLPEILYQPPDRTPIEFFLSVLDAMAAAPTDLVLRLEDDVLVNRHMLHNIATWTAPHDPRFGLGWLFDPGGSTQSVHDHIYQRVGETDRWHSGPLHGALGVLAWRRDIPQIRQYVDEYTTKHGIVFDLALAHAATQMNRFICVHAPSLIEHQPSTSCFAHFTHPVHDTSNGSFRPDYRRAELSQ
jgi:hypothetical protein